ncbi:MAG TPA: DUF2891 domain-containing protein [Rhizomicrobium sp.]|nr:DUF2891 domain-containing protein [Rhizomicrobium sp.]
MHSALTPTLANRFASIALGHVTKEFPNKLDHVLGGSDDALRPRDLHPIFYGSFDWHSCVHSYWLLARIRRLFPELPLKMEIDGLFERAFTKENIDGELAYLGRPLSTGFERPYGWAWALMLVAEFRRSGLSDLNPLGDAFAERFRKYLPKLTYPIRGGTHGNSAFALILAGEYARIANDDAFLELMTSCARNWFGDDRNAPAWEPSGDDFLSSTLVEAECMRSLLPRGEFRGWLDRFLPDLGHGRPASIFQPAKVSDRSDGKIAHLDGLNLSRAWCMRRLAKSLDGDPRQQVLLEAAETHIEASLAQVSGDYMGEHWLATYAFIALEAKT